MCDHGTCVFDEFVVYKLSIAELQKNGSYSFLVLSPSVAHVHSLSMIQSLMRGSSMCNVACPSPGQPY